MAADQVRIKKQEKIDRVIEAASRLFASSEYHQVCMDDIAAQAKVGKGTLYNIFASKEDLYFSIIRNRLGELIALLEETYDKRDDTMKNLRSLIRHLHKFMSKYHHFYLIWKREENLLNGSTKRPDIATMQERRSRMNGTDIFPRGVTTVAGNSIPRRRRSG